MQEMTEMCPEPGDPPKGSVSFDAFNCFNGFSGSGPSDVVRSGLGTDEDLISMPRTMMAF